jgi:hypothetical protein
LFDFLDIGVETFRSSLRQAPDPLQKFAETIAVFFAPIVDIGLVGDKLAFMSPPTKHNKLTLSRDYGFAENRESELCKLNPARRFPRRVPEIGRTKSGQDLSISSPLLEHERF